MRIVPAGGFLASTELWVRYSDDVTVYSVSDWTARDSFLNLSCGVAEDEPLCGIEISPDGTFFITNGASGTGVYDAYDGTELYSYTNTALCKPSISKDGNYIALMETDFDARIIETSGWTLETSIVPTSKQGRQVTAWSNDGTKIAIGDSDGNFGIWNVGTWTVYAAQITLGDAVQDIQFSADDSAVCVMLQDIATNVVNVMTVQATLSSGDLMADDMGGTKRGETACFDDQDNFLYCNTNGNATDVLEKFSVSTWTSSATPAVSPGSNPTQIHIDSEGLYLAIGISATPYLKVANTSDLTYVSGTPTIASKVYGVAWNRP